MAAKSELEKFDFLRKLALELGAVDAKIIPASNIVVEDRVVLKCRVGCNNYGKTLACPPHVPTAEEFRKIVSEYKYAIFMKFNSKAEADPEIKSYLSKTEAEVASSASKEVFAKWKKFWADWNGHKKDLLENTLKVEKEAMSKGYPLAFGMISGMCHICEKCNVEEGICRHPTQMRYSEEAVGVNVQATAKKAGVKMTFPLAKTPESFATVLID
jgi:predicted metal-binding protein